MLSFSFMLKIRFGKYYNLLQKGEKDKQTPTNRRNTSKQTKTAAHIKRKHGMARLSQVFNTNVEVLAEVSTTETFPHQLDISHQCGNKILYLYLSLMYYFSVKWEASKVSPKIKY